ncbi:hypothetical protein Lalb_Chr19g0127691 [Lupinus albus]|uniref:Uncharacterized protein n=1 Tax=Lupinus albus TaxID=3870 RepID=A0A6A4P019_LUPAL|nr:hypothetical protein Lalb_Chr19g0127691 [Lupinus albus]
MSTYSCCNLTKVIFKAIESVKDCINVVKRLMDDVKLNRESLNLIHLGGNRDITFGKTIHLFFER